MTRCGHEADERSRRGAAMKLQDFMLQAMAKRITWFEAAEIIGISCRQMQRWKTRFNLEGYEG